MNKILVGVIGTLGIGALLGTAIVFSGAIDMGADTPHSALVYRAIEFGRERAIARSASDVTVPADIDNSERVRRGAGNYDAMCVGCHLSPGVADSEIRKGLYPMPPNLTKLTVSGNTEKLDARQFWIIKHGIKASGMPSWSKGGMEDAAIWDVVALLRSMPALSAEQYAELVEASDGHSHGGMDHPHGDGHAMSDAEDHHAVASPVPTTGTHSHQHGKDGHGDHKH